MYDRVIIPLDGSEDSEVAVEEALNMVPAVRQVDLVVIESAIGRVHRLEGYTMYVDQLAQLRRQSAMDYLRPFREKFEAAGVEVTASIEFGDAIRVVPRLVRETGADLVLLGGKEGNWFWGHTGMASISRRLAKRLDIPVVTVHEPSRKVKAAEAVAA